VTPTPTPTPSPIPAASVFHPHTIYILLPIALTLLALCIFGLIKSQPLRFWFGGALSAFVSGFIEGMPIGSSAGGGIAVLDGQFHADLGSQHILIEVAHILAIPILTGLADIRTYQKSNPFPNVFAPGTPAVPIPKQPLDKENVANPPASPPTDAA
jgi:hypothetical protein